MGGQGHGRLPKKPARKPPGPPARARKRVPTPPAVPAPTNGLTPQPCQSFPSRTPREGTTRYRMGAGNREGKAVVPLPPYVSRLARVRCPCGPGAGPGSGCGRPIRSGDWDSAPVGFRDPCGSSTATLPRTRTRGVGVRLARLAVSPILMRYLVVQRQGHD